MCHALLRDPSLHCRLLDLDRNFAAETRERGCWACDGPLHRADYPRRPRGSPELAGVEAERRFSFCCALEGCRRRSTPRSVRFLGPRVYAAAVVTLASAAAQDLSGRRLAVIYVIDEAPQSGHLFVFFNRRRTLMKGLVWDDSG